MSMNINEHDTVDGQDIINSEQDRTSGISGEAEQTAERIAAGLDEDMTEVGQSDFEQTEAERMTAEQIAAEHAAEQAESEQAAAEQGEDPADDNNRNVIEGAARAAEKYTDSGSGIGAYTPRHTAAGKKGLRGIKIAAVAVLAAAVVAAGLLTWRVYGYNKVHRGVVVCGINAGGLTAEQLKAAITKYGDKLYDKSSIKFSINGQYVCDIDGDSIEAGIDAQTSADLAYAYGREGGFFVRAGQIIKGFTTPVQIDAKAAVNEQKLGIISNEAAEKAALIAAQNSYKVQDGVLYLDTKNMGLKINSQDVYAMIKDRFETANFEPIDYSSDVFEPNAGEIERILNGLQSKKKNATLDLEKDPTGGTISPEEEGISFDIDQARKAFEESNDRYVKIKVNYIKPDVTAEQLKANLFRDELANVATTLNANLKDRTTNVRLAAQAINGKILNPGDEFSYNKTVGKRTAERGYKNAKVFQNGGVEDGLGGGICQVSSTLYMAVLDSNLKVTERKNHVFAVAYTPIGLDATVSYGVKDFRFKNSSSYPIKIIAEQSGSEIRVIIKGTKTDSIKVKMETEILSKVPYQKITIQDDTLERGKSVVKTEGYTGYKARTYRILLDANGKQISRTLESTSNYSKLDKVVRVGTKGGSTAASGNQPIPATTAPTTAAPTTALTTAAPTTTVVDQSGLIIPPSY